MKNRLFTISLVILGLLSIFVSTVKASTEIRYSESQFFLVFMFIIFAYFLYLAEEKEDAVYFLISGIMSLPLGIYMLYIAENSILHYFFGLVIILVSMYLFYLFLATSFKIRKKEKEE